MKSENVSELDRMRILLAQEQEKSATLLCELAPLRLEKAREERMKLYEEVAKNYQVGTSDTYDSLTGRITRKNGAMPTAEGVLVSVGTGRVANDGAEPTQPAS